MANEPIEEAEQAGTDINFDCPLCQKNISIDARGAGLMINCPDCQQEIQVPSPADGETASAEPRLQELENLLAESRSRQKRLALELETAQLRLAQQEAGAAEQQQRFEQISAELVVIQNALDRLVTLLQDAGVRDA